MKQIEKKHLNKKHDIEISCKVPKLKPLGYDTYPVIPILLIFIFVNYFQSNKSVDSKYTVFKSTYSLSV